MPNGKKLIDDMDILHTFHTKDFFVDGMDRIKWLAIKHGVNEKQVYALLKKPRFDKWLDYGVTIRGAHLSDSGLEKYYGGKFSYLFHIFLKERENKNAK